MRKTVAARNGRPFTREDLNDSIAKYGELVDSKLDRVLDKIADVKEDVKNNAAAFALTTSQVKTDLLLEVARIDRVHGMTQSALESLKKFRYQTAGALAAVVVVWELFRELILKR